jgi:NADH dehydrogenase [ubiquinone] 1 alpha subcomplex assembly factor 1
MNFLTIIFAAIIMNNQQQDRVSVLLNASIMITEDQWRIVNDGVMGGLSSSRVFVDGDSKIIFSGNVSLENSGGFASLRSQINDYNFENFAGIEIKIMGDGKHYSISMKETSYFSGYFYTCSFETKKNDWTVLQIPFDRFKLYYFGKDINSGKKVPLSKIKEISLLIGDKQEGAFKVEIDHIKLY